MVSWCKQGEYNECTRIPKIRAMSVQLFCQFICASYVLAVVFIHIALKYTLLLFVFFFKNCKNCLLPDAFCKFICASYFLEVVFIHIARWFIF